MYHKKFFITYIINIDYEGRGVIMVDKAVNYEERIRRAEEIYNRRRNNIRTNDYATLNISGKKDIKLFKKMFIQILICLAIYFGVYVIQNNNYIFSESFINKTKEILSYDINFNNLTEGVLQYINNIKDVQSMIPEQYKEKEEVKIDSTLNNQALILIEEPLYVDKASSLSQVEEDAKFIKENYSIIKPVEGVVSSGFGSRNPTTPTVPKYHTGIDIANVIGTKIIAAMEGEVTQVSSVGAYGNHLRIKNGEIVTLYAHCSKIYVKEGDKISQGQEIAEVGDTGNVTGPHLHFEIRRNNEFVDPAYVIDFE